MAESVSKLEGDVYRIPFLGPNYNGTVAEVYAELVDEYAVNRVLVLKRFPTGIETFTDKLAREAETIERPTVAALASHAASVVQTQSDPPELLSNDEYRELAYQFVEDRSWGSPYLAAAADQESFTSDVVRLLNVITWSGLDVETDHQALAELAEVEAALNGYLAEHGYRPRGAAVARATEVLAADGAVRSRVQSEFDCVLAVEFEEFGPLEREYLDAITSGKALVCVGETDSSVQRIWNEADDIRNWPATDWVEARPERPAGRPAAVARYLATGRAASAPEEGTVAVIDEETFVDQVRTVADEIERLRSVHGWSYDEFAIGVKASSGPIPETIRILRQAGIPTASATVSGFADDPAIRELLAVCRYLGLGDEQAYERLASRVPAGMEDTDALLEELREASALEAGLREWAAVTELKMRVAEPEPPLEARTQFQHVREVFELAAFVDETPLIDASWERFSEALERAFGRTAAETSTAATDVKDDGVLVDAVRVLKNASWKAVFMLNVVEGEYPSRPGLTRLFPETTVEGLAGFPGVTDPSVDDVQATFRTAPAEMESPYRQYYRELARRLLAVGCRAATERVYFGLYEEEDATTGKRTQPSRFLVDAYEQYPWIETLDHDGLHGQSGATQFALSRVDRALVEVKRAATTGGTVELAEIERDLTAIQELLDDETADAEYVGQVRDALRARVDFADGRVRHE